MAEELIDIERVYKAKCPSGIGMMIVMLILILLYSRLYLTVYRNNVDVVLNDFGIFLIICYFAIFIFSFIWTFKKPFQMCIRPELLKVNNREFKPSDIKEIRVQGYFRPLIGIIPVGKKIPPINLSFRILEEEDKAIKELMDWASRHEIKMSNQKFMRWI